MRDPVRWPVPVAARRSMLTLHVVSTAAWLGLDVALGVLVFVPMANPALTAACYQVLPLLFWPVLTAGLLALLSGVGIGVMTRWGLVRHWWVAAKLVMNLLLLVLIALLLHPALTDAGEFGRALATGTPTTVEVPRIFMPPVVSTTVLLVATVLSVWKPKGRVSRRR
ncbi:membrane protein [Pseudonocardia ailaonensis]|uniref:Membrane protein n=1 Tax=Pseudonocardia ailaonensis TaxID=367279 RepID=A0ABN2NHN6_9PSEU